jgi:hypothetical protein
LSTLRWLSSLLGVPLTRGASTHNAQPLDRCHKASPTSRQSADRGSTWPERTSLIW